MGKAFDGYVSAWQEEPVLRAYLVASFLDDLGIAASIWPWQRMLADLFVDQRTRASVMVPALLCFLGGTIVGGPLADWPSTGRTRTSLGHWRWRAVVWGRAIETVVLAGLAYGLAGSAPTVATILPYFLVSALMKTALRPTRIAWEVDLLVKQSIRYHEHTGLPELDERGDPLQYKTHLMALSSLTTISTAFATLIGLVGGGWLVAALDNQIWIAFAVDVVTNLVFVAIVFRHCHVGSVVAESIPGEAAPRSAAGFVLAQFGRSLREAFAFLATKEQRALVCLLAGGAMIEVVTEFYDGSMVVRHTLHGSDDAIRYGQILWAVTGMLAVAALPVIAKSLTYLGRIFLVVMVLDALVLIFVGRAAGTAMLMPFIVALGVDSGFTRTSATLMAVAQNSATSAEMRGRLAATYAFFVLILDLFAEEAATSVSEAIGIPSMITWLGVGQLVLMVVVAVVGGRALWNFGIVTTKETAPAEASGGAMLQAARVDAHPE